MGDILGLRMSTQVNTQDSPKSPTDTQALSLLLEYELVGLQNNRILDLSLPLLIFATRLSKIRDLDSEYITNIKEEIAREILAISSSLSALHIYEDKELIKLRYCLCVFIDEMLLANESFINSHFANHTLTIRLFDEMLGGDKFYDIVGQWLLNPSKHKDMLEFVYTCLILGYKGKYALQEQDSNKINHFCNDIATTLAPVLDSDEERAFKLAYKNIKHENIIERLKRKYIKPFFGFGILGVVIVAFVFSYLKLESHNTIVQNSLKQYIQTFTQEK